MDEHWVVKHALPGDGQNRPAVGSSMMEIQERYNILSNIQAETYEFGIPPVYADPETLDFDALPSQTAEPAAHYPARAKPGKSLADSFFQPAPAVISHDFIQHQQDLVGPVALEVKVTKLMGNGQPGNDARCLQALTARAAHSAFGSARPVNIQQYVPGGFRGSSDELSGVDSGTSRSIRPGHVHPYVRRKKSCEEDCQE